MSIFKCSCRNLAKYGNYNCLHAMNGVYSIGMHSIVGEVKAYKREYNVRLILLRTRLLDLFLVPVPEFFF